MSKRKKYIIATLIIFLGLSLFLYPFFLRMFGERYAKQLMEDFKEDVKDEEIPDEEIQGEQATCTEALPSALQEDGVIGIIKIESIGIEYPVIEGANNEALNKGIGHLTETAAIGTKGNCVLCGHNGSRRGTFFTPLNMVNIGDKVELMDKKGVIHEYKIVNTKIVEPRDNSIKNTDGTERLTLFTCASRGTQRFVCECLPIED